MEANLIYGHHPVVEAIKAGKKFEKVLLQSDLRGEIEKEIRHLTKEHEITMQVVPREKLDRVVRGLHQGVVAWLALVEYESLETLLAQIVESGKTPLLLLLDGITDVRNFGAICRSAECMGVDAVILPQSGSAPANEEAMKASAGALARVRLCRVRSMFSTIEYLQENDIQVVSTALVPRAKPIYDIDLTVPTALLLGSEGDGLHPKLIKMSDEVAKIPQATDFDSLNVSVSAGVALYEILRQRNAAK